MPIPKPRAGNPAEFHIYPRVSRAGTLGDPEYIIWSSIRHLCSRGVVQYMAGDVYGIKKKKDRDAFARNLKIFIQHAYEFYDAAQSAKPNTAPLIYYYSFLNLAKAFCESKYPGFHKYTECYRHGISWRPSPTYFVNPEKEFVSITTRGVWHTLWESITKLPCPAANPTQFKIKDLFQYCPEITTELNAAFGVENRLIDFEMNTILYDEKAREAWLQFSIDKDELKFMHLSPAAFIRMISSSKASYQRVQSSDSQSYTFESARAQRISKNNYALKAIEGDILDLNVFTSFGFDKKLAYSLADQRHLPFRMPQLIILYTLMFWLGSLVRYDPHSVNDLMDSKYWTIIDGFMSQSRLWMLEQFEWALYQAETTLSLCR
jgi:hypothetical protein